MRVAHTKGSTNSTRALVANKVNRNLVRPSLDYLELSLRVILAMSSNCVLWALSLGQGVNHTSSTAFPSHLLHTISCLREMLKMVRQALLSTARWMAPVAGGGGAVPIWHFVLPAEPGSSNSILTPLQRGLWT